ncbi:hypothetical protein [Novosphingobium mangrovi (ex Huang et al. 2023)]|uniref:Uncharacterized protein n=1 Tax=Novosphingobium mangrovi (ex Huang et al. 2023) TaxID=2976432 RepID=A0ABT2I8H0_9SPHN|nr:hypothetical protein [Novosphingobium mangrovi (ex Huang et al. 2023)]MCT2401131.1 hypothetical protein [Novosphingobium mangrovi (ex Huang et al. 2023)]
MDTAIEIAMAVAGLAVAALLFWPRVARAKLWRATVTPLASIIGSGFLILGPILTDAFGSWAILAMGALCLVGYLFGAAIRYNIERLDEPDLDTALADRLEVISSWALAFAYVISVAYYLNLFGAFAARIFGAPSELLGRLITTGAYLLILGAGLTKGFSLLERMEQLTVSIKLIVIAALIAALTIHAGAEWEDHNLAESGMVLGMTGSIQLLFGLIVTVQGFETSRYLGRYYSATERQESMRISQWIATGIYLVYVVLLTVSFESGTFALDETAIIDLMRTVSVVLGPLLILAALSAQFSAAVADTNGSGGLFCELTGGRMGPKMTYVGLVGAGLALTWLADVFEIVSLASRAFAFYYALQSALAGIRAWYGGAPGGRFQRCFGFAFLTVLGLAAALFGAPVEG